MNASRARTHSFSYNLARHRHMQPDHRSTVPKGPAKARTQYEKQPPHFVWWSN